MKDRSVRVTTAVAVLLVALIAAVVSYQHLYAIAAAHGETRLDAALLPLSIDGTVVAGSLLMLRAARAGRPTPWLARGMLTAAVLMTVAANVAFGWRSGAWGVLMAGWPAAAFLLNAEATISFGRKTQPPYAVPIAAPIPAPATRSPNTHKPKSKKTQLLALYAIHPDHGDRSKVSKVAAELAPQAGLAPGTARTYLYTAVDGAAS